MDAWCRANLGSGVAEGLAYASGVGATYGVLLADGRKVAIKAHRARQPFEFLAAKQRVQSALSSRGFPCPAPVGEPAPFGDGIATAERWLDEPSPHDGHDPRSIEAMSRCLHDLLDLSRRLGLVVPRSGWMLWPPSDGSLWPPPHSDLFDFEEPIEEREAIESLARAATERIRETSTASSRDLLGHADICPHNARFDPDVGSVTAVFDWDSITMGPEEYFVGVAASACTADWSNETVSRPRFPTFDEARTFVAAYESERGRPFTSEARRRVRAFYAYATSYHARLGDEVGPTGELEGGTIATVRAHGLGLLDL